MLVNEVAATRGFTPPPSNPDIDDIEDPYFQSAEVYDRVGVLINSVVTRIASYLALVRTVF
jgi:protein-tyrosine phosphatase